MKNSIIHVSFSDVNFKCPHCDKDHDDRDDKYLDKCNANKSGYTKIKCTCGETFGMTYDMMTNAIGFEL
jgi:hypothetical protein